MSDTTCDNGYQGRCCCNCSLRARTRSMCACLDGPGARCKSGETNDPTGFACLAFSHEGLVITDWTEHGSCEAHEVAAERKDFEASLSAPVDFGLADLAAAKAFLKQHAPQEGE